MSIRLSNQVVLVAGKRTPFGRPLGGFGKIPAPILGAHAIIGALSKTNVRSHDINSAIFGFGIQTGLGQNPTKQTLLAANLDNDIPCTSISQGHCSGSKSVILAYNEISLGISEAVLCGGIESISLSPFMIKQGRIGSFGDIVVEDCYLKDGLHDPYFNTHSGMIVEKTNARLNISRYDQDTWAMETFRKRDVASKRNYFEKEIYPFGQIIDDEFLKLVTQHNISPRPMLYKEGTVTAYNAAFPADGGCALLFTSEPKAKSLEMDPISRIIGIAEAATDSHLFPNSLHLAASKLLNSLGINAAQIHLWDINDYYSTLPLSFKSFMKIDPKKINVNGGTISIGDPMGASSARQILSLSLALKERNLTTGIAVSCDIGGVATAIAIQII